MSEDASVSISAPLALKKPKASNSLATMVVPSRQDRMAELDRFINAGANNNNDKDAGWADPLQNVSVKRESEIDETSNATSFSGTGSNHGSSDIPNDLQPSSTEPWQQCPPVNSGRFHCPYCSCGYSSKPNLNRHITQKHHDKRPNPAHKEQEIPPGSETSHSETKNEKSPSTVECSLCEKRFANRNPALIFHQIVVHKVPSDQFSSELTENQVDCPDCRVPLDTKDNEFPRHPCKSGKDPLANQNCLAVQSMPCPLCSNSFEEKSKLVEHVSSFHRANFGLFEKNGVFFEAYSSMKTSFSSHSSLNNMHSTSPSSASSSPENIIPINTDPISQNDGESHNQPAKRKPLANRASAADKWRNVDGFNCAHCGATFLTSQSRAQHVRWRHPEMFALLNSSDRTTATDDMIPATATPTPTETGDLAATSQSAVLASPPRQKSNETFVCPVCNSSYISARSRAQHIRWSHPEVDLNDPTLTTPNSTPEKLQSNESENSSTQLPHPTVPQNKDEAALLSALISGYKGSCEVCGVHLANAQGRSQHLRYKHPEAWALLQGSSSTKTIPSSSNGIEKPHLSPDTLRALQMSPSDLAAGNDNTSPDSNGETGSYACVFCDKSFSSKRGRGRHYFWTHRELLRNYSSKPQTDAPNVNGEADVAAADDSRRWYACTRCPKRFLRRVGLSIHIAQAHRRHGDVASSVSVALQETVELKDEPGAAANSDKQRNQATKKSQSPSANACCLVCNAGFAGPNEVTQHLREAHNVSEPTDSDWCWAVVHADEDEQDLVVDEDEDDDLMDGDFVREIEPTSKSQTAETFVCQKCPNLVFPNSLLYRGHMLLEHHINMNPTATFGSPTSMTSLESDISCGDCGKTFNSTRALHIHENHTRHGAHRNPQNGVVSTIRCVNCADRPSFASQAEFASHQLHLHKTTRCAKCSSIFIGLDAYQRHACDQSDAAKNRKRPADVLPSKNGAAKTARQSISGENVSCASCKRSFASTRNLHIHQKMSANCQGAGQLPGLISPDVKSAAVLQQDDANEIFPCNLCSETFTSAQGLACHKRSRHDYISMSPRSIAKRGLKEGCTTPNNFSIFCKHCQCSFPNRWALTEHLYVSRTSKCGEKRGAKLRAYQNQTWRAVRMALQFPANLSARRRELIRDWKRKNNLDLKTPPPPPSQPIEAAARRKRTSKKRKESPRPPGKRTSPRASPVARKQRVVKQEEPELSSPEFSLAPPPAPAPSGANKCTFCAREFPTPVQLMIHYCRDNCAAK